MTKFLFFLFFITIPTNFSCPIDFNYVKTFPWDKSLCQEPVQATCCQTLRSVFGIGLANYLKETTMFYFPDANTSLSCIASFEKKLEEISIPSSFLPTCFNDSSDFVNSPATSCAGIVTTNDWTQKVSRPSPLESSCNGDLTGLTRCGLCLEAGLKVNSFLVSLHPNSTKCFFFTILYAAAVVNDFGPEDVRTASCILALPLSTSRARKKSNTKWVFGLVGGILGIFLGVIIFLIYRKWDKNKKNDFEHDKYVLSLKSRVPNIGVKWFHISELEKATNGFSQKNMIGKGGFGVVYKGILSNGSEIAVKQILDLDSTGDDEFTNEVGIISKIRHKNLLALRGFCVTSDRDKGKRRFLVYDFMSNGNLDDHLFNTVEKGKDQFSWPQRKNVIIDVAKGLAYLHYGIKPAIFHRDIKATNILLDSNKKAKVSDFGLAKQSEEGQSHLTTRVAGTYGYLAPEYALYGQLTEKSDVYSFGILILEIMSGRRVLDASNSSRILITDWACELVKSGKVEEIFHESIRTEGPKGIMERFVLVGILCAHAMVAFRPTIADALKMLEGDIDIPRLHERPLPLSHELLQMPFKYSSSISTSEGSRDSSKV